MRHKPRSYFLLRAMMRATGVPLTPRYTANLVDAAMRCGFALEDRAGNVYLVARSAR